MLLMTFLFPWPAPQQLLNRYANFRHVQGIKRWFFFCENWSLTTIERSRLALSSRQKYTLSSGVVSLTAVCWPHSVILPFICVKLWLLLTALSCTMSYPMGENKGWSHYLEEEEGVCKKTKNKHPLKNQSKTAKNPQTSLSSRASQNVL